MTIRSWCAACSEPIDDPEFRLSHSGGACAVSVTRSLDSALHPRHAASESLAAWLRCYLEAVDEDGRMVAPISGIDARGFLYLRKTFFRLAERQGSERIARVLVLKWREIYAAYFNS